MEAIFVRNTVAKWADIDANRHLKTTAYIDYATNVRVQWLSAGGFELVALLAGGIGPILLEESTKFFREVHMGNTLAIDMRLIGLSRDDSRFSVRHSFRLAEEICAVHEIHGAWFDLKRRCITTPPGDLAGYLRALHRCDDFKELEAR